MRNVRPRESRLTTAIAVGGLIAALSVACAETTASAPAPAAPAPKEIPWGEMNKEQRIDYMKTTVLPRMKQAFTEFSPDRYSKMNCVTCHGDSAADGSFKMPNPKLPKLPATSDGFKALAAERPAVMEFMKSQVKPKMAAMLGEPEFNPATNSGFGCMECHTTAAAQ